MCADVAADVSVAARGGAWAAYLNAGQVCTSAERFYVAREVYDDFLDAFVSHARELRVGDPLDPSTDVGPMVSAAQRDKVSAQVEAAVAAGASLVVGGDRAGHSRGHYFAPAVTAPSTWASTLERCPADTIGPMSVDGSSGSPTRSPRV